MPSFLAAEPLPVSVLALAHAKGLGQLRKTYDPQPVPLSRLLLACAGLAVVVAGAFVYAGVFGLVVTALSAFGAIATMYATTALNPKLAVMRLHMFDNGLVVASAADAVFGCRWAMMTTNLAVTRYSVNGAHVRTTYSCQVTDESGAKHRITQLFADPQEWSATIERAVLTAQLPGVVAAIRAGRPIGFGPLVLGPDGIRSTKGTLPWADARSCEVKSGSLRIRQPGRLIAWATSPVKDIANLPVFVATVRHCAATARAGTMP